MAHPEYGDIIHLCEGAKVHTYIPENLHFRYAPFQGYCEVTVEVYVGKVHYAPLTSRDEFIKKLTPHLKLQLHCAKVTEESVSNFINSLELDFSLNEYEICVPSGEYRVYNAYSLYKSSDDVSYFVHCENVDNPNIRCYYSYSIG